MALTAIGPVSISHGNPKFSAVAAPTTHGIDSVTIAGSASWAAVKTLRALVRNPHGRATIGDHTGILEWLAFDDDLLDDWTGYYLLEEFQPEAAQSDSLVDTDCPFTLTAAFVGTLA